MVAIGGLHIIIQKYTRTGQYRNVRKEKVWGYRNAIVNGIESV